MEFLNKTKNLKGINYNSKILFLLILFLPMINANIFEKNLEVCNVPKNILVENADNFVSLKRGEFTTTIRTSPKNQIQCHHNNCPEEMYCFWKKGKLIGSKESETKCIFKESHDKIFSLNNYEFRFEGCTKGDTECFTEDSIYVIVKKTNINISPLKFFLVFSFFVILILFVNHLTNGIFGDFIIAISCLRLIESIFDETNEFIMINPNSSFTGSD